MKKQIAIILMILLISAPIIQGVSASKTVFITSDNIVDKETDTDMLNSIKQYIEEISNREIQVIVDNQAPSPGEGWRSIAVTSDVSINIAASDAANYIQLASAAATGSKQIIFINIGDYDLDNHSNFLRRAWDDNYSNESLAGLRDPGTLLINSGIQYIQLAKDYPQNVGDNGILEKYDEDIESIKNYCFKRRIAKIQINSSNGC